MSPAKDTRAPGARAYRVGGAGDRARSTSVRVCPSARERPPVASLDREKWPRALGEGPINRLILTDFYRFFRTFLGDFTPDRLDSRSLQTPWEWKSRVLPEEYYIFDAAIPLEVEREQSYGP